MVQNRNGSIKIFSLTLLFIKRIRHAWFITFLYVFLTPKKMIHIIPSTRCIPPGVHNIPWCMDYSIHQEILEVRFIVSFLSANKTIIADEYKENSFLDNISRL